MKTKWTIALFTTLGLGLGTWARRRYIRKVPCACSPDHREGTAAKEAIKTIQPPDEHSFSPEFQNKLPSSDASWQEGLKRWGTRPGIIDVANEETTRKKKEHRLRRMVQQGQTVAAHFRQGQRLTPPRPKAYPGRAMPAFHTAYDVAQVTVTNTSGEPRAVSLWEANRQEAISPPKPTDVEDHRVVQETTVPQAVHPQGMVVNPVNGLTYVTHQLSDNVSVIDTEGRLVKQVNLSPMGFPGLNSPVAVAVHTTAGSPHYGKVYVIGSVADTLSVIGLDFQVERTVPVSTRPLAIAFNPVNEKIYVSHLVSGTVAVIDPYTWEQETLPTGSNPRGLAVTTSGDIYVTNSGDRTVWGWGPTGQPLVQLEDIGEAPTHVVYQPVTNTLYVSATGSNEVVPVRIDGYQKEAPVPVPGGPYAIAYQAINGYIYVASREGGRLTVIGPDLVPRTTLLLGTGGQGLAMDPIKGLVYASTASGKVQQIGYRVQSSAVTVDDGYAETREDFQHHPASVKHAKFVFSGDTPSGLLQVREQTATGRRTIKALSFSDYRSPQHVLNVAEVSGLDGTVLDGANAWDFTVAPYQSITVMVYYRQLDRYRLLPETARKSIGVEMGKGIPKAWSHPKRTYNPIQ